MIQGPGQGVVTFNPTEAHELTIKPSVQHRNPLTPSGNLIKVVGNLHEYRMLHIHVPKDTLQPETSCSVWNPISRTYISGNRIICNYFEAQEELCPDEFLESCLHNISSRAADVEAVMLNSSQEISAIVAALIVGLQTAIGSSIYKIGWHGDPTFGTAQYYANAETDLLLKNSVAERDRLTSMLQRQEGIWSILRRRAAAGNVAYVDTNDGTLSGNATLPANILGYLQDLVRNSHHILRYYRDEMGITPTLVLQDGLFNAYKSYLQSLPGGDSAHRYIVEGFAPQHTAYVFEDYPVIRDTNWNIFDHQCGLIDPATGLSLVQRAMFTAPDNLCLLTNAQPRDNMAGGLRIQQSPLLPDKGKTWMHMRLGIGAGVAHNELASVGYNSSFTYTTS